MNNYDLNKIIPQIDRCSSANDEGKYYDLLRLSPSVTVISGGQSGIDSVGLKAAGFLGLPAFAIMPIGGRREGEQIEAYAQREHINFRKIELETSSYRFRTYANAYYGDVTLIFDFVDGSDGTKCTVKACEYFSRPYLLITDINNAENTIAEFLLRNSPSVINIAGNSLSKINKDIENSVGELLIKSLRKYCFLRIPQSYITANGDKDTENISIAIPNFEVSKNIFKDFFRRAYNIDLQFGKRLVLRHGQYTLILARPREIIRLMDNGVDIGFVGQDLCYENSYQENILLQTGLIPNATVLVARQSSLSQTDSICSQYPVYAERLLHRKVAHISGSAEAYLSMGFFDACVDSYQTGDTVAQNNLFVLKKFSESAIVMLGNQRIKNTAFYNDFVAYLRGE